MTQIIPLSEGSFTIGSDKVFRNFHQGEDQLNDRPRGSLLVEIQPFVIINDRDIILLDTGLGFKNQEGEHHLEDNLMRHQIDPRDVTKILLSHLHKDHAGGLNPELFSEAAIYIYRKELDYARKVGYPSYYPEELAAIEDCSRVHFLEEEEGLIEDYIHYQHTDGHCPEHLIYKIESEDGLIFYGGDEAPQYKQMKFKYIAKYDYNGRRAMELRKEWAAQGAEENWQFLFYHDIQTPIARMGN